MDPLATARSLGFTMPSPAYLFGALVFGVFGIAAFRLGRKRGTPLTTGLGVALMVYPYVIGSTVWLYVVGTALCAAAVWDQRR